MQQHDLLLSVFLTGFVCAWSIYSLLFRYAEKRMQREINYLIELLAKQGVPVETDD